MADLGTELDRIVGRFESAWAAGPPPDLGAFLPAPASPQFLPVLAELVRVDLEFRRRRGEPARLDRYRGGFPALFADRLVVRELAFEEYRLRVAGGERPHPREYAARYGIDTSNWPPPHAHPASTPTRVLNEVGAAPTYPAPGATVAGFRLASELGRGAFGRVYLAEQIGLAGRRVAVKFSTRFGPAEPETLARLQHAHIVPVYSTQRAGAFQIVVMPFLGALTVADLLDDLRARGTVPGSGRALADTLASRRGKTATPSGSGPKAGDPGPAARPAAAVVSAALKRLTYPEAVLWIGAKLADALAHAHDRGILHRDIKPANVLLTDDGQPMLLDFNLAADAARPGPRAGGTPAYMALEQLQLMRGRRAAVDGRADVFALGVVLFEMLTGRHPFPPPAGPSADTILELIRLRSAPLPDPCALNDAVTPSAGAIVLKCLAPDPARRYQSAAGLREDLARQLADQPLAHAREPSLRERVRKWRRRHPRVASSGSVAAVAVVLVALLGGAAVARQERVKQLERASEASRAKQAAEEAFRAFRSEARDAVPVLVVHGHDPKRLDDGERRVRTLLAQYSVLDDGQWATRSAVAHLSEADQIALRVQVAEALMLLARVGGDRALALPPSPERDALLNGALALIERAEAAYGPDAVPRAVLADRAEALARLGRTDAAVLKDDRLPNAPAAARDAYLAGTGLVARGQYRAAVHLLEAAAAGDPRQFWTWFNLGFAHLGLGNDADAEGCFNACVALEPDYAMGHFNRGLARLNRKQYAAADADFTTVLRLKPGTTDALVNRALARLARGQKGEAEADLTKALELGASETRLYFLRADVRDNRGDKTGSAADRAAGLANVPTDEPSWVARGLARADTEPERALADFDEALKLNPRSFPALQNRAFVLSEKLNQQAAAVATLGKALELYPDSLPARAGRAVLLARKGDRAGAHGDADHCLGQRPGADIVYQLAGVYALTSRAKPEDAKVAFRLLSDALGQGHGFALLAIDPDLAPLHETKEFQKLLEAAKAVQATGPNL